MRLELFFFYYLPFFSFFLACSKLGEVAGRIYRKLISSQKIESPDSAKKQAGFKSGIGCPSARTIMV